MSRTPESLKIPQNNIKPNLGLAKSTPTLPDLSFLFPQTHAGSSKHPPCLTPGSPFPTPQALSDWLKPRLPSESLASWGVKPGTKNVHNLWLELSEGEISLLDSSPPLRTVNVVTVRILGKDNLVLVESRHELSDGSVRDRFRPLSEKMKPHETTEEAVVRAVKEELGSVVDSGVVRIVPGSYRKKLEERNSVSYPGLPARYVLHSVDAWVEGFPEEDFLLKKRKSMRILMGQEDWRKLCL
ncbi:caffeic acid 3-O-methyltransferase 1-like isoform 1 [Hibiscus syriacus]|uniref:Caffeic acid 3-O-methyltransferase 1-like isoform 1 n=1 Tax=Hibiscus syriacus TaxID=106335 RepID=A0A6A3B3D6_HIBSY|nr:caffeic acid 3-O-methyltransferase 1-like isoform 1 [Hibiscus syriacus]